MFVRIHKIFLVICAMIVLHGTMSLVISVGGESLRSYTVQSNFLLVIGFVIMAFCDKFKVFRSYISFAVLVCISVTGIVYNFILVPFNNQPMVLLGWGNFVTHLLSMVFAVANYLIFEEKNQFTFKHIWAAFIPTFLYWIVFISIGSVINWYPYFFMNPRQITWGMIFFWFVVIFIYSIGLSSAIVLFDKMRKKHALCILLSSLVICVVLVFAAGDRVQERFYRTLVTWNYSYSVEALYNLGAGNAISPFAHVVERGGEIGVGIALRIDETEQHVFTSSFSGEGVVTVLLLICRQDGDGQNVLYFAFGEDISVADEIELIYGAIFVEFIFLTDYESAQRFFESMQLEITPEQQIRMLEAFNRTSYNDTVTISFWMGTGELTPERRALFGE